MRLPEHAIESKTDSVARNLLKTLGQTAVMWGVALWMIPAILRALESEFAGWGFTPLPGWLGWGIFACLGATGIYCGGLFAIYGKGTPLPLDTTTRFIVLGPYRWVRNPMAITGVGQGIAIGLFLGSPTVIAYSLLGAVLWQLFARPWEEEDLRRRFGDSYTNYRAMVRNWIPSARAYPKLVEHRTSSATDRAER